MEETFTKEYLDTELRKLHKIMTENMRFEFPFFEKIIILTYSEAKEILSSRMRRNLANKGVHYSAEEWAQIERDLSEDGTKAFFENIAFYDENEEALNICYALIDRHPDKVMIVCVHELAEKLFHIISREVSFKNKTRNIGAIASSKDVIGGVSLRKLLSQYTENVLWSVFREGCCEAIALETMLHSEHKEKVSGYAEDLLTEHSKWAGTLLKIDDLQSEVMRTENKIPIKTANASLEYERKVLNQFISYSQLLKSVSYPLGYPLAKEVLDNFGLDGLRVAIMSPPSKPAHFIDPSLYIPNLKERLERR